MNWIRERGAWVPDLAGDIAELATLERARWPAMHSELMAAGVPVADRQGFRTMQPFADPGVVNQTAVAAAADTILWNPAGLAPNTAIPANTIRQGQVFKITAWGVTTTAVTASQTLILTPRFGTTTGGTSLGVSRTAPIAAAVQTNVPWAIEMWCHFRSIGTGGTVSCFGKMDSPTIVGTAATTNVATLHFGTQSTTPTTVDTTVAAGLLVSANASLATQTFQALSVVMETLN